MGDVFTLTGCKKSVLLQVIGDHPYYGWIIRVVEVDEGYSHSADFEFLKEKPELYIIIIGSLAIEEREGRVDFVGSASIPDKFKEHLPIFRSSSHYLASGRHDPNFWWLNDGASKFVGTLTEEQKLYPLCRTIPAKALVERIERGWDPMWEFKGPEAREFARESTRVSSDSHGRSAFFLIFAKAEDATGAKQCVESEKDGFFATIEEDGDDEESPAEVSLTIETDATLDASDVLNLDDYFESLARRFRGSYDGNEIALKKR